MALLIYKTEMTLCISGSSHNCVELKQLQNCKRNYSENGMAISNFCKIYWTPYPQTISASWHLTNENSLLSHIPSSHLQHGPVAPCWHKSLVEGNSLKVGSPIPSLLFPHALLPTRCHSQFLTQRGQRETRSPVAGLPAESRLFRPNGLNSRNLWRGPLSL